MAETRHSFLFAACKLLCDSESCPVAAGSLRGPPVKLIIHFHSINLCMSIDIGVLSLSSLWYVSLLAQGLHLINFSIILRQVIKKATKSIVWIRSTLAGNRKRNLPNKKAHCLYNRVATSWQLRDH